METQRLTYLEIVTMVAALIAVPIGMYFLSIELYSHAALAWGIAIVATIGTTGECALGYLVGDTWAVSQNGYLSHSLCSVALEAIASKSAKWTGLGEGEKATAACKCPLKDRQVTFEVRAA
jgi:uncharacterized repeat protein (TIGR04076 family)